MDDLYKVAITIWYIFISTVMVWGMIIVSHVARRMIRWLKSDAPFFD